MEEPPEPPAPEPREEPLPEEEAVEEEAVEEEEIPAENGEEGAVVYKCPDCDSEVDKDATICYSCGFSFVQSDEQPPEEQKEEPKEDKKRLGFFRR